MKPWPSLAAGVALALAAARSGASEGEPGDVPAAALTRGLEGDREAGSAALARDPVARARAHFKRGVALYRRGALDAALAEFTRAYDTAPHHRILYNLAQIQTERRDYVQALGLFRRYLEEGAASISAERIAEVERSVESLSRLTARVELEFDVPEADVYLDGEFVARVTPGESLPVNAGVRRLRIERAGFVAVRRTLTLVGEDELVIEASLQPVADDEGTPPRPPASSSHLAPGSVGARVESPERPAFWVALMSTGALAGATATGAVLTQRATRDFEKRLRATPDEVRAVDAARERVRTVAAFTDIAGIATLVSAGAAAVFYFSASEREPATVPVSAYVGPGGGGVRVYGSF